FYETFSECIADMHGRGTNLQTIEEARRYVRGKTQAWLSQIDIWFEAQYETKSHTGHDPEIIYPRQFELLFEAYRESKEPKPNKAKTKTSAGYVYLVKSPVGYFKIGRSKNPDDRVKTFGVKLPFDVEILHTIKCDDYHTAESFLHKKYADKRSGGEWFDLTPEDVEEIKSITSL